MKNIREIVSLMALFLLPVFFSCRQDSQKNDTVNSESENVSSVPLFERLSPSFSGVVFVNGLKETDTQNMLTYEYYTSGAGVASGDINNDGLQDLFFCGNESSCRLYLNRGDLRFSDITASAGVETNGWCTGATMADVNGDGFLDIYVCRSGKFQTPEERKNLLFINGQNNTFKESADEFGIANNGYSTQAVFFDADNDTDLDLFLVNHGIDFNFKITNFEIDNAKIDSFKTQRFYLNTGANHFTDYTREAGVFSNSFGLNAMIVDFNEDGFQDLYVCNDYQMPDVIYINNGKAVFRDSIDRYLRHMPHFSMGSDAADFNNDGMIDLMTLDMLPEDRRRAKMLFNSMNYDKYNMQVANGYRHQRMQNCLQLNNGNGTFSDIALYAGVYRTDWSWSALFADFDNDGWKDLFITNGIYRDVTDMDFTMYRAEQMRKNKGVQVTNLALLKQMPATPLRNYIYKNNGDLTYGGKNLEWNLNEETFSYGASYADLDNDGDLELIINNLGDTAFIYKNKSNLVTKNNFLKIKLSGPAENITGIGAIVKIYSGDMHQLQQLNPVRGYMSSSDNRLNFGLGKNTTVDSLLVIWPGGKMQKLEEPDVNKILTLDYKNANSNFTKKHQKDKGIYFENVNHKYPLSFTHTENLFIDYKREPLLPHMFSKGGPYIATGDVNGDKLDDFFIGNAKGSAGKMFIQKSDGSFVENESQPWKHEKIQEDMGCLLFDSDGDRDMDLYVVSGGSEENVYNDYYQDRIYINNGKGKFKRCVECIPKINSSGSCITAADFDKDGDLDLFRGGRVGPLLYPLAVNSYLLQNNNGHFTDVISHIAPEMRYAGLVKDAVWCDFNNDKAIDLVVCGEWMPIMLFKNDGSKFEWLNKTQNGELTRGWWNKITADDFDKDGDVDFVAGNFGLNSRLVAAPEKPLMVVAKDFDHNGLLDAILCNYEADGKSYPVYGRDEMTDQIRPLKKTLLSYADYADKTIDQIFPVDTLKTANVLLCNVLASCFIENTGNSNLRLHPLPAEAQFSPINGIISYDFNKDGNKDLLVAGNSMAESVDLGLCDAGNGVLLLGDGKGNFKTVKSVESGFSAINDVRNISLINLSNHKKLVVVANNNSKADIFLVK